MIVPFKALIGFLQEQRPDLTLSLDTLGNKDSTVGLLDVGRTSVQNYIEGYRKEGVSVPTKKTIKEYIFKGICSSNLYDIKPNNYKEKALALISYLLKNQYIHTDYIDVQDYINKIEDEQIPEGDNQFEIFLDDCVLLRFLCDYLSLWKNNEYREAIPPQARMIDAATPEVVMANRFGDNYEKYLIQQLVSEENNDVLLTLDRLTNTDFDFSFFVDNKLTLISGPGGQGKTSFLCALKILHSNLPKTFDGVFIVPLINLTELSVNSVTVKEDFISNYIKQNDGVDIQNTTQNYLILLDGFNEFRSAKNKHIVDIITESLGRLISDIFNNDKPNLSIVLTTRESKTTMNLLPNAGKDFMKTELKGTPDNLYEKIKEKYERLNYEFEGSEISRLAKTPLYALMLDEFEDSEIVSKIQNKYKLFDEVYRKRANQRLGDEVHKSAYDKSYYLYYYYVVLPTIAYTLNTSKEYNNDFVFYSSDLESFVKAVVENGLDEIIFEQQLNTFTQINGDPQKLSVLSLKRFLLHEENRIINKEVNDECKFKFEHQEWRDYLVAKHINDNVNVLKSRYKHLSNTSISALHLNCNVDSNIGRLILQSFDMDSTEEHNTSIAKKFFKIDDNTKISNYLYGIVKFLHVAFDFNEYLQLRLIKGPNKQIPSLHFIFYVKLTKYLIKNKSNRQLINAVKSNNDVLLCICEILSKEAEYFRREESYSEKYVHYQESYNVIELAKKYSDDSDIMKNQEGKLYVCLYEESLRNSKKQFDKIVPKELSSMKPIDMFIKGQEQLSQVAEKGFHLSANAIGIILSTPAPVLINSIPDLKPDYCAAFRYYMEVIYGAEYINRDISYTVRQALSLLMKGYIKISESNGFDPEEGYKDLSTLHTERCSPVYGEELNDSTVRFAESLVRKADGQDAAGMNFLRGYVAYASNKSDEAKVFWTSPLTSETTLMYNIARKYYLGEKNLDEDISSGFKTNAEKIQSAGEGKIDLTHPVYWYIEAKEFLLSLVNNDSVEKYNQFFDDIEERYAISSVVNSVHEFLSQG